MTKPIGRVHVFGAKDVGPLLADEVACELGKPVSAADMSKAETAAPPQNTVVIYHVAAERTGPGEWCCPVCGESTMVTDGEA